MYMKLQIMILWHYIYQKEFTDKK